MNRDLGQFGENWSVAYLTRLGYRIVNRNVRYRVGEIDMVAWEGGDLVFIEVKCRRGTKFGSPQESITPRRFQHLQQAIDRYLSDQQLEPDSYRVDVMAIEVGRGGEVIRHQLLRGVEAPVW